MDVFVTGGTGQIGSAVVKRLLADGAQVIGLARTGEASEKLRSMGAHAFPGDLREPDGWVARAGSCDAVVHTGATFTRDMGQVDRNAMLALKQAARHRKQPLKLAYTGGIWLYPASVRGALITEKTPFAPLPAFRYMAETIRHLSGGTDLNLIVLHPGLVCSTESGPIAGMTRALKTGEPFRTRAHPDTFWPLVDRDDLAALYSLALAQARFRISLIGSAIEGISVRHLAAHVSARHGLPLDIETEPDREDADPETDWHAGYALSQRVDISHAQRAFGWRPEQATIEDLVVSLSR